MNNISAFQAFRSVHIARTIPTHYTLRYVHIATHTCTHRSHKLYTSHPLICTHHYLRHVHIARTNCTHRSLDMYTSLTQCSVTACHKRAENPPCNHQSTAAKSILWDPKNGFFTAVLPNWGGLWAILQGLKRHFQPVKRSEKPVLCAVLHKNSAQIQHLKLTIKQLKLSIY